MMRTAIFMLASSGAPQARLRPEWPTKPIRFIAPFARAAGPISSGASPPHEANGGGRPAGDRR